MQKIGINVTMASSHCFHANADMQAPERVTIQCPYTHRLLARIDATSLLVLATCVGGLYLWCRGCHMEHFRMWSDIIREQH